MVNVKTDHEDVAELVLDGEKQLVILPSTCRFEGTHVYVRKIGSAVILSPRPVNWDHFFNDTQRPSEDFMRDCVDASMQDRKLFE